MKSSCPHCGQHFDVDEADVGKEADCTNCGKHFQIKATAPSLRPPSVDRCPFCGGELVPGVKKCRHCGEWLDVSARPKSPVVFVLLGIFGGLFGLHHYYAGSFEFGCMHTLTTVIFVLLIVLGIVVKEVWLVAIGGALLAISGIFVMTALVYADRVQEREVRTRRR